MRILITGATGQVGQGIVKGLAGPHVHMILHYKEERQLAEQLTAGFQKTGGRAAFFQADLSEVAEVKRLLSFTADTLGGIDMLIHCASMYERMPFLTMTETGWERALAVDLKAACFLAQAAAGRMSEGGRMIFFSDIAAARPYPGALPYVVAKAGIEGLTRSLAVELAPKILVNAVALHLVEGTTKGIDIQTQQRLLARQPLQKAQHLTEIVGLVRWLANEAQTITGQVITLDSGKLMIS